MTGDSGDAGEGDFPIGTDATSHHAAQQQQNAPPHTPAVIEDAENIHVDFDPATPARLRFLSARDDGNHDDGDTMETSWPDNGAVQPQGAVGSAPPAQDLLNVLQCLVKNGERDAQGNAILQVANHLVNEVNQIRQSVAREACANTRFRLSSRSVSQQCE